MFFWMISLVYVKLTYKLVRHQYSIQCIYNVCKKSTLFCTYYLSIRLKIALPSKKCTKSLLKCSYLQTWYELVFPWQPLVWYLDVLRTSPYTDCLDIYQAECQERRFGFNQNLQEIYDAECSYTCGGGPNSTAVSATCVSLKSFISSGGSSRVSSFYDDQIPFAGVQERLLRWVKDLPKNNLNPRWPAERHTVWPFELIIRNI